MVAVVQRVSEASVHIEGVLKSQINQGLMILLGVSVQDSEDDVEYLSKKISQMRIFNDADSKMNLSIQEVGGEILVVSQFTLLANTKKGNRPSYTEAARPEQAIPLYHSFIQSLQLSLAKEIKTGEFGAMMQVSLVNDGPVTIVLDSKQNN